MIIHYDRSKLSRGLGTAKLNFHKRGFRSVCGKITLLRYVRCDPVHSGIFSPAGSNRRAGGETIRPGYFR